MEFAKKCIPGFFHQEYAGPGFLFGNTEYGLFGNVDDVAIQALQCTTPFYAIFVQYQERNGFGIDDKRRASKNIQKIYECIASKAGSSNVGTPLQLCGETYYGSNSVENFVESFE